jgi:hypothetical protein
MRGNHNEARIETRGERWKNVPRIALLQYSVDADTAIANARDLGIKRSLRVVRQPRGSMRIDHERSVRESDDGEIEDMRNDDASAERAREIDGPIESRPSQLGEVGTYEDDSLEKLHDGSLA